MTQKTSSHSRSQSSSKKNQQQQPLLRGNNKNHLETIYEESGGSCSTVLNKSTASLAQPVSNKTVMPSQGSETISNTNNSSDHGGLISSRSILPVNLQIQKKKTRSLERPIELTEDQKSILSQPTSIIKTRKPRLPVEIRYRDGSKQYILPITNPHVQHYRQQLLQFNLPPKYEQSSDEQQQQHSNKDNRRSHGEDKSQKDRSQQFRKQFIIINAQDIPSSATLESSSTSSPEYAPSTATSTTTTTRHIPQQYYTQHIQHPVNSSYQQQHPTSVTRAPTAPSYQLRPHQRRHVSQIDNIRSRSLPPPPPRLPSNVHSIRYASTDRLRQQSDSLKKRTEVSSVQTKNTPSLQIKLTNENDIHEEINNQKRKTTTIVGGVNSAFKPFSKRDIKHQKLPPSHAKNVTSQPVPNGVLPNQQLPHSTLSSKHDGQNSSQFTFYEHHQQQYRSSIRPTSMHTTSSFTPSMSNKYRSFSSDTNRPITNYTKQTNFYNQQMQYPNSEIRAPQQQTLRADQQSFNYNHQFAGDKNHNSNKRSSSLQTTTNRAIPVKSTVSKGAFDDATYRTRSYSNHNPQPSPTINIDPSLQWYTFDSCVQDLPHLSSKYAQNPIRVTLTTRSKENKSFLASTQNSELEQRLLQAGLSPETVALYERILEVADVKQPTPSLLTTTYR
ncbi:unnamed protein product [Didymodactylos carnosus]|uniref:Uncharacterized protein n=1 Tax=Didymodactylos carnosus TaxID=1234261 RepID=A0A813VTC6_9BILA|nr:unnamed protein product [Didymodactylos carnosus]CAF1172968.1 unnamed protein product [Didymodactylos carnosus]CAF3632675.1 unnamed protein product [Didymodactylos carnosus]CAF3984114.1 unnamed protein product [Didymodactylos carnosus]